MNYYQLSTTQKALFTKVLEAKRRAEASKEEYARLLAQIQPLVKEEGSLVKGNDKLVYTPETTINALDKDALKRDGLYEKYLVTTTRKEAIRCILH